ncbi:type I polyketide synthase [Kitasatospora sp. NPDC006697]|uniref:type I polyketide synthase n=1 Tax=Kitasatospora sp. NPDC006697 TaxID=3364020 RepID=UPI00368B9327
MEYTQHAPATTVAVIGLGCQFPGADGPTQFWHNLLANTDSVTPVPADRFDIAADYAPSSGVPGKTASRHGGFISDVFAFDHAFFGISPAEAKAVDPQQRLLLHATWEALEQAGIRPSSLAGTHTGVFVGQATAEYSEVTADPDGPNIRAMAGSRLRAVTAGRISYALDLLGPSVVLDTACSSSLVAVHTARQSLLTGECDLAVAAGVNVVLSSHDAIAYSQGSMLSPEGRCRFGAADANGFVRSDGVGVVVLKRLADAERDGDLILATLLGSAVTNDGRGSGLLLQPAVSGQVAMLRAACRSAGITPDQLDYVESHGTGTAVGDAVELRALAQATGRPAERPLLTGSVKSNIGHAESAAGIAGLIKAILIARHGLVPASLHCAEPNPVIAEEGLAVSVVTRNTPLPDAGRAARIGVSSFGISGTNAHVVVGAYQQPEPAGAPEDLPTAAGAAGGEQLLVLSARSAHSLSELASSWAGFLEGPGRSHPLHRLCAAAALRRDDHPHRLWVRGATHEAVAARLRELAAGEPIAGGGTAEAGFGPPRRTAFVFSGQGSQWLGMGRGLLESSPAFRATLADCDRAIQAELGWSVIELLTGAEELPTAIDQVQPALWAVAVSLAEALRAAGLDPDVCLGHSMGEAAAAYVSGALSLRDACAVICRRSRLMRRLAGLGAMLAVELSAEASRELLAERPEFADLCVAVENSPSATVLAGPAEPLGVLAGLLEQRGVFHRIVPVEVASHSPAMELISDELVSALVDLTPRRAEVGLFSSVLAEPLRGEELVPRYWQENLRRPVRFTEAVRALCAQETVFLEVSPHPVLAAAVDDTRRSVQAEGAALGSLRRDCEEADALLETLGRAYANGARVDWSRWYGRATPVLEGLPTYAWDREVLRHPVPAVRPAAAPRALPPHVREAPLAEWGAAGWATGVSVRGARPLLPSVYLEAMLTTARTAAGGPVALLEVRLGAAQFTGDPAVVRLRVTVSAPGADGLRQVRAELRHGPEGEPVLCAQGTAVPDPQARPVDRRDLLDRTLARRLEHLSAPGFQGLAEQAGFGIDEELCGVQHVWRGDGRAVAQIRPVGGAGRSAAWESGLLALLAAYRPGTAQVPTGFGSIRVHGELPAEFWALCRVRPSATGGRGDVLLLDSDGFVLAEFLAIELHLLPHRHAGLLASFGAGQMAALVSRLHVRARHQVPRPPGQRVHRAEVLVPAEPPAPAAEVSAGTAAQALVRRVAHLLEIPEDRLDHRRPLRDLGLDSLMASQLRTELRSGWGLDLAAGRLLGPESFHRILATIA